MSGVDDGLHGLVGALEVLLFGIQQGLLMVKESGCLVLGEQLCQLALSFLDLLGGFEGVIKINSNAEVIGVQQGLVLELIYGTQHSDGVRRL